MLFGSISCKLRLVAGEQITESPNKRDSASCSGGSDYLVGNRADGISLIARVKQAWESNDNKF
jgi:hypothetical protein